MVVCGVFFCTSRYAISPNYVLWGRCCSAGGVSPWSTVQRVRVAVLWCSWCKSYRTSRPYNAHVFSLRFFFLMIIIVILIKKLNPRFILFRHVLDGARVVGPAHIVPAHVLRRHALPRTVPPQPCPNSRILLNLLGTGATSRGIIANIRPRFFYDVTWINVAGQDSILVAPSSDLDVFSVLHAEAAKKQGRHTRHCNFLQWAFFFVFVFVESVVRQ